MYKLAINPNFQEFKEFTFSIREFFTANSNTIHKARNEIKIISHQDKELVVKSFKEPNIINKVAYTFFRDSKAKKSYNNSLRLGEFAPEPLSYIEFHKNSLLKESYFISEHFAYDFTIREPLLEKSFPDRAEVFQAFARFSLKLHNADIFHNDYSPGNILIKKEHGAYIFKVVDVNRMHFTALNQQKRAQNFSKLWADDSVLKIIATEYAKHYKVDDNFTKELLYFSNKNKKVKNFKKRLKGKAVND